MKIRNFIGGSLHLLIGIAVNAVIVVSPQYQVLPDIWAYMLHVGATTLIVAGLVEIFQGD